FPFDSPGHGPRDDLSTIQRFLQSHAEGTKTLCWVPSFFSNDAQRDLGMLEILEHILTGERFGQYSNHLSPQDRQAAKSVLESQRSQLRGRVQSHMDAAYGLDALMVGSLDSTHELDPNEQYASLLPGFSPQPPVAVNLSGAMQHLLSQALEHEFPAAPHFEAEVKSSALKKVYEQIHAATQVADGRLPIDKTMRPLVRQIAAPLQLGEMGLDATHFVLGQHWKNHFSRRAAEAGGTLSVSQLRDWLDDPKPMGLPKDAQNLVILLYAAQTSQTVYLHGAPFEASLANLPDACELRKDKLPETAEWELALQRAGSIFGVAGLRLLSAGNVSALSTECKKKASEAKKACNSYCQRLKPRLADWGIAADACDRFKTAAASQVLVDRLQAGELGSVIKSLSTASVATSEAAMGECISKAAELEGNLDTAGWQTFELIKRLPAEHQATSQEIIAELTEALSSDEHVIALAPALKSAQAKAMRLLERLVDTKKPDSQPAPVPPAVNPPAKTDHVVVEQNSQLDLTLARARDVLSDLEGRLKPGQSARVNVSWVIEQGGDA
ncbi:MAG: hypothetical protein AB7V13_24780, partial [Pseudorhodoplanes sp.]